MSELSIPWNAEPVEPEPGVTVSFADPAILEEGENLVLNSVGMSGDIVD